MAATDIQKIKAWATDLSQRISKIDVQSSVDGHLSYVWASNFAALADNPPTLSSSKAMNSTFNEILAVFQLQKNHILHEGLVKNGVLNGWAAAWGQDGAFQRAKKIGDKAQTFLECDANDPAHLCAAFASAFVPEEKKGPYSDDNGALLNYRDYLIRAWSNFANNL